MPVATLVCGPVGAGKTTRARELAAATRAVPFTIDDWFVTLYGAELPEPFSMDWANPRLGRCEQQIAKTVLHLFRAGVDVVLDLGFMTRAQRDRYRGWVASNGGRSELCVCDAPLEVRRDRVRRRNEERSGTFTLHVTDDMFALAESWWQPPTPDELAPA